MCVHALVCNTCDHLIDHTTVQCIAVQCSAVQINAMHCNAKQRNKMMTDTQKQECRKPFHLASSQPGSRSPLCCVHAHGLCVCVFDALRIVSCGAWLAVRFQPSGSSQMHSKKHSMHLTGGCRKGAAPPPVAQPRAAQPQRLDGAVDGGRRRLDGGGQRCGVGVLGRQRKRHRGVLWVRVSCQLRDFAVRAHKCSQKFQLKAAAHIFFLLSLQFKSIYII